MRNFNKVKSLSPVHENITREIINKQLLERKMYFKSFYIIKLSYKIEKLRH